MVAISTSVLQFLGILVIGLLAGSMFGIWRGYDPSTYSPATFIEVHQGAVRGLNTLLPALALAGLALSLLLAFLARNRLPVLGLYLGVALLIVIGGAITRLVNQPINEQMLIWNEASLPADWASLRDTWWTWHLGRLAATVIAQALIITAVFVDRD